MSTAKIPLISVTNINSTGDVSTVASYLAGTYTLAQTNTGLKGVALPALVSGFLKYNGSAWVFDSSSYQPSSTILGTLSSLANASGALTNNGSGTLSWASYIPLTSTITAGGPIGSATVAPIITYNAYGQLTAVSSATITPAWTSVTSKPTTLSGYSIAATDVTAQLLTGYTTGTNTAIVATNSILVAFENLQAQVTAHPGTVTSVGLTAPSIFTVSGSPVTSSGSLSFVWNGANTNLVRADGSTIATTTYPSGSGTANTITKFTGTNTVGNSTITDTGSLVTVTNPLSAGGAITGSSIIKSGGTSSQFLKADGSVDSTSYLSAYGGGFYSASGWGSTAPAWIKVATLQITSQYGACAGRIRFMFGGGNGGVSAYNAHSGSVCFRMKQQSAMTSGLDVCTLWWEYAATMGTSAYFMGVKTTDTSSLKSVDLYIRCDESYENLAYSFEDVNGSVTPSTTYTTSAPTATYNAVGSFSLDIYGQTINVLGNLAVTGNISATGGLLATNFVASNTTGQAIRTSYPSNGASNIGILIGSIGDYLSSSQAGLAIGIPSTATCWPLEIQKAGVSIFHVDTNGTAVANTAALYNGYGGIVNNYAVFAHSSIVGTGGYAIAQASTGQVWINASTGYNVSISNNNGAAIATFAASAIGFAQPLTSSSTIVGANTLDGRVLTNIDTPEGTYATGGLSTWTNGSSTGTPPTGTSGDGTWWNIVNVRHRDGSGDGASSYGGQLAWGMTAYQNVFAWRTRGGSWYALNQSLQTTNSPTFVGVTLTGNLNVAGTGTAISAPNGTGAFGALSAGGVVKANTSGVLGIAGAGDIAVTLGSQPVAQVLIGNGASGITSSGSLTFYGGNLSVSGSVSSGRVSTSGQITSGLANNASVVSSGGYQSTGAFGIGGYYATSGAFQSDYSGVSFYANGGSMYATQGYGAPFQRLTSQTLGNYSISSLSPHMLFAATGGSLASISSFSGGFNGQFLNLSNNGNLAVAVTFQTGSVTVPVGTTYVAVWDAANSTWR